MAGFWAALVIAIALAALLAWVVVAAVRVRSRIYLPVFALVLAVIGVSTAMNFSAYRNAWADRNLSSIRLLPGYTISHFNGDSYCGRICRQNDEEFVIGIDIGSMAGWYANPEKPQRYDWIIRQEIDNRTVWVAYKKSLEKVDPLRNPSKTVEKQWLYVTFVDGQANFFAEVFSERDIAEMLLMVLTHVPPS
ncbi:hypothetical protein [Terrimicrobium sacchariphilum]|uniref:hypothetical protein n=1 Tax=Terrimicrobium sacchariphilum TaxID=690879 RepID=UPI00129AC138|nr:hypothetical protein [Terrimicrobium sacchariphilum]